MFKTGAMSCACTPANTDIGKVRSWREADVLTKLKVRWERGADLLAHSDRKLQIDVSSYR